MQQPKLLTYKAFGDDRGTFCETFRQEWLTEHGISDTFIQDNVSLSRHPGTIRGLHFQSPPHAHAKLVSVLQGRILDVVVDIRKRSPHYGKAFSYTLSAFDKQLLYVPIGFAHGFCTTESDTVVSYKVSAYYSPEHDKGLLWNDPALSIDWPVTESEAHLSDKDRVQPTLATLPLYFD